MSMSYNRFTFVTYIFIFYYYIFGNIYNTYIIYIYYIMIDFKIVPNISESTRELYSSNLFRLLELCKPISTNDDTLVYILNHPFKVYWLIRNKYTNWNTINNYIIPVITILKYYIDITKQVTPESIDRWNRISDYSKEKHLILKLENKNNKNIKTTYQDLIDKIDKIEGRDQLLLAMYTLIPPVRADYHKLKICHKNNTDNHDINENTLIFDNKNASIILVDYKTKKAYGKHVINLPDKLFNIIKQNITETQSYLFENKYKEPYTRISFSEYVSKTMSRLFNEKITINILRHIYITYNINLGSNPIDKLDISKKMLHSTSTQVRYIWAN